MERLDVQKVSDNGPLDKASDDEDTETNPSNDNKLFVNVT